MAEEAARLATVAQDARRERPLEMKPPEHGRTPRHPTPGERASLRTATELGDAAVAWLVGRLAAGAMRDDPCLHRIADHAAGVGAIRALGERVVVIAARGH